MSTTEELAALKAARNAGVRIVKHGENSVTYATTAELNDAIARLEAELAPSRRRILRTYGTDRGFR